MRLEHSEDDEALCQHARLADEALLMNRAAKLICNPNIIVKVITM